MVVSVLKITALIFNSSNYLYNSSILAISASCYYNNLSFYSFNISSNFGASGSSSSPGGASKDGNSSAPSSIALFLASTLS